MSLINQIQEAVQYIQQKHAFKAEIGIVLGSGLATFSEQIQVEAAIAYADIPHFPVSTVKGHQGKLLLGSIGGKNVIAMSGRFHYYEGYRADEIVFPIRVMKYLGVKTVLLSNAAGAMNSKFSIGDIMLIEDHVSLFVPNPLIGKNEEALGPRFPDMSEAYSKSLLTKAEIIAQELSIPVKKGIYIAVTGPTFETKAEYRLLLACGGDAVGMSTVQECIIARHMGLQVFAMSVITDIGIMEEEKITTHEEVLEAAKAAEPKLAAIFRELIHSID
jgi:purine-nucleoside phosphorylase